MHTKPLIYGFITGVLLVFIATLGLAIGVVAFLRPLLSPGTEMIRGYAQSIPAPLIVGILLNGVIYAIVFSLIASTKKFAENKTARIIFIVLIIIVFVILTGMMSNLFDFLVSPDKSWIFNVGA